MLKKTHLIKITCSICVLALVLGISTFLIPGSTQAASGSFTEDFSTTTYKDASNTTANWDTTAERSVLTSSDTWTDESSNVSGIGIHVYTIGFDSNINTLYVGGAGNSRLYSYNGTTWIDETSNISGIDYAAHAIGFDSNENTLYVGGNEAGRLASSRLYSYNGTTWTDETSNVSGLDDGDGIRAIGFDSNTNTIYVGGGSTSELYSYNGTTWTDETANISGMTYIFAIGFDSNANVLYVGGYKGKGTPGLYSYNGTTWTDETSNISGSTGVFAIGFDSNTNTIYVGGSGTNILYSYNGTTWTDEAANISGMTQVNGIGFDPNTNIIYIGGEGTNILYSYNNTTWTDETANISGIDSVVYSVGFDSNTNTVYVGGGNTSKLYSYASTYNSPKIAQSSTVDSIDANIAKATLTATETLNGQTVAYHMSVDGGSNWESVTSGEEHTFTNTGSDLRWKATLTTSDSSATPEITQIDIAYASAAGRRRDLVPPGDVTDVNVVNPDPSTGDSLMLSWINPNDADLQAIKIYRSSVSGEIPSESIAEVGSNVTSYTDTGLIEGTTYYYTFKPIDTRSNLSTNTTQYEGMPVGITVRDEVGVEDGVGEEDIEGEDGEGVESEEGVGGAPMINEGDLVQVNDGIIYLIQNNTKRLFVHDSIFNSWKYSLDDVKTVDQESLSAYSTGRNMLFPEGALFRGTTKGLGSLGASAVYLVSNGFYRPIYSAEVYHKLFNDFDWSKVIWLPDDVLDQIFYPNGHALGNVINSAEDYRIFPTGDIQDVVDGQKTETTGFNKYYYLILAGVMILVLVGVMVGKRKRG